MRSGVAPRDNVGQLAPQPIRARVMIDSLLVLMRQVLWGTSDIHGAAGVLRFIWQRRYNSAHESRRSGQDHASEVSLIPSGQVECFAKTLALMPCWSQHTLMGVRFRTTGTALSMLRNGNAQDWRTIWRK